MPALTRNDLTWTPAPFPELVRLSVPIAVSTLSYSAMTLVDTLFVGRLGAASLAGVGLGGTVAFALMVLAIGLLRGVKIRVSQAAGAGEHHAVPRYLGAGLVIAVALGVLALIAGELVAPAVATLAASAEQGAHAATYLQIRMLGAPVLLIYVALRETQYGLGSARAPMIASVLGNGSNIALDAALIFGADMGVAGAAWSTVAAQVLEAGVLVWVQRPRGFGLRAWRARHVRSIVRVGLPTGIQFALEVGSFLLLAVLISAMSELEMAAHQIVLHITHVSFLPAFALAEAASIMIGQAVGADRDDLVLPVSRMAMTVAAMYTAACTAVFAVAAPAIVGLFTDDAGVRLVAVHLLYVACVFGVADGANVVARGALRGTGDVRVPAVIGIVCAWTLVPPLAWLLGHQLGLGALGGWLGLCVEIILCAGLLWWRLCWGHWRPAADRSRLAVREA